MVNESIFQETDVARVLDVPGEKIYVAKRQHWFVLAQELIILLFFSLLLGSFAYLAQRFISATLLSLTLYLILLSLAISSMLVKIVMDWYCHLYIVTSRKLIDVSCSPLFSNRLNDVFLDQVRITEIDVNRNGILNELLDIGTVTITFDRPTRQQEFMFENIGDSEDIGILLSHIFVDEKDKSQQKYFWTQNKDKTKLFSFTEEIFPKVNAEMN